MAGVHGVAVSIMDVIGMVAVLNRLVSAAPTMAVVAMLSVFGVAATLAFIPVSFVLTVSMAIVEIISMALVLNGGVAALCIVLVCGVSSVLVVWLVHDLFLRVSSCPLDACQDYAASGILHSLEATPGS
jgi:hypothetical protein